MVNSRKNNRRRGKKDSGSKARSREQWVKRRTEGESSARPRPMLPQSDAVERLLSGIGVPEPTPFMPDDFQIEALEAIEFEDVLVTAPTGSGKTWIAREEFRRLLLQGKRAWYTTPLKALTNSKYAEFAAEFGAENVGILTGDRKENFGAPLIVGTTEIYRNQVFDAMRQGDEVSTDFVILDEAHFLADEGRGHVWEEAIILTPPRIRLLLLSATVGRAEEFARWISDVRGTRVRVIDRGGSRPVELRAALISADLHLYPLFEEGGKLNRDLAPFLREGRRRSRTWSKN